MIGAANSAGCAGSGPLALSETEQEKYRTREAELDMLLCETRSTQAFKHLKRMFTLEHLGLTRPPIGERRHGG